MLFRSAFHREKRMTKAVEKDHRHISRIIGLCWAELSEAEKDVWRQKAELEKQQHALVYPEYRFKPIPRTKQPIKRNVKRNSPKEIERCHKIAKLLKDGKSGEELTDALRHMEGDKPSMLLPGEGTASSGREERMPRKQRTSDHAHQPVHEHPQEPHFTPASSLGYYTADEPPPFRSPLLPPSDFPQMSSKRPYSVSAHFRLGYVTNRGLYSDHSFRVNYHAADADNYRGRFTRAVPQLLFLSGLRSPGLYTPRI
jgi:hypothetical protein